MSHMEQRLQAVGAPTAPVALAPAPPPPPPPRAGAPPPSQGAEESSGNSSDQRRERKERKKERKREKRRRRESQGDSQASGGGGVKAEESGEVVVDEGGVMGCWTWRGTWWRPTPPSPPPKLTLPQWLLKALGPTFAAAHKAALVPWSAQALQEGCARDQPLFAGALHAHVTLEWVFPRLRCQIRWHGENKGTWWQDSERGGAWTRRPVPGEPLSLVPEGIIVTSLSSLNLCGDPRGVWFGTAHFHVALQHWVTLGWCRQWRQGKGVHFAVQWTVVLPPPPPPPRPVYDPAAQHQYEGSGGGTWNTATAFAEAAVPAAAAPPAPADVMADPVEAPTASTHFRTAMAAVWVQGAPTCFEVCVLVC